MEVEIYNMDEFEGRLRFYQHKVDKLGGKIIIKGKDIKYVEPSHEEVISILKKKIEKDGQGILINFGKRSALSPYIQYADGTPNYYHRMYLF